MGIKENFLPVTDHMEALIKSLPADQQSVYRQCKNTRLETAYRGRSFILYQMKGRTVEVLDRLVFNDFVADDLDGTTATVMSGKYGSSVLNYTPWQVGDLPVFMFMPLHAQIRWSATPDLEHGSLGFPVVIRVMGRRHPREPGVVHCETGNAFSREFPTIAE